MPGSESRVEFAADAPTRRINGAFEEFTDPRIVALYDTVCASRDDFDFYLALAAELEARTIVDIGCGTGTFACELAGLGYGVTGVDPSAAMLEIARNRPGGELVRWVKGDASRVAGSSVADLAIMTGHVAQVIPTDEAWAATLDSAHRLLRPGGHVAFECRDPRARGWEKWMPDTSRQRFEHPQIGPFEAWFDRLVVVPGGGVSYEIHYVLAKTGEELVSHNRLRFPSEGQLMASLADAGFAIERLYGDWDRRPVGPGTPELIYVARRG